MSTQQRGPLEWSAIISDTYVAGTKPPLTDDLTKKVRRAVSDAVSGRSGTGDFTSEDLAQVNEALDRFELALDAAVGPRIVSVDTVSGVVQMRPRSEADHPLRAFGGQ